MSVKEKDRNLREEKPASLCAALALALSAASPALFACAGAQRTEIEVSAGDFSRIQVISLDAQRMSLEDAFVRPGALQSKERGEQGGVRLVHFFATWCFPCLAEVASLNSLSRELSDCGLISVGIGLDLEGIRVLTPFAEASALSYPIFAPGEAIRQGRSPFGQIRTLPTTFLFGRDGELLAVWEGPADVTRLRKVLEQALGGCGAAK